MILPSGSEHRDVVVVGGGVIGLATAWRVAALGIGVALIDDAPGSGASWAAAGMLAPVTEVHYGEQALLQLNLAAARRYESFTSEVVEATGHDVGYVRCGTLLVARDQDENAALADLFEFQTALGLEVERLDSRACRDLEPGLAPAVRGGILVPGDHQVDNRALVDALKKACAGGGVEMIAARVGQVTVGAKGVSGVITDDGRALGADSVIVAGGCRSSQITGIPPEAVPAVRPVKGQLLHLRAQGGPIVERTTRGLDAYLVARPDGRLVIGATVEEMGFDDKVTAGAVHGLLRDAYELVPGITELELVEVAVGLRPGTPDNGPIIGPSTVDGLIFATGHYRNGILLAPVTADAIAELIDSGEVPAAIRPFSPQRFG